MSDHESTAHPHRKHPVHQPVQESGNRAVIVFVTVCTKDRCPVLATPAMHQTILQAWSKAGHWLVGRYVILPDHIHLFLRAGRLPDSTAYALGAVLEKRSGESNSRRGRFPVG